MSDCEEAWILAADLDGGACAPHPFEDVAGMPSLLRLACTLAAAGVKRVVAIGVPDGAPLAQLAGDPRLRGVALVAAAAPPQEDGSPVLVARADRVMHRDLAKALLAGASLGAAGDVAVVGELDAIVLAPRAQARELCAAAGRAGGFAGWLAERRDRDELTVVPPPWRGFAVPAAGRAGRRAAEWRLIDSLRKPIDGLASKWINRHISLRLTRLLMRTPVMPNHVSLLCLALGVGAGAVCALGGWAWAVVAVLMLELGSILDGVDGELARLRYQFSVRGEWLDTLSDDLANASFIVGASVNLRAAGAVWAAPVGGVALVAFLVTQGLLYRRLLRIGRGDLMSLSWGSVGAGGHWSSSLMGKLALLTKRDFFVSMFVVVVAAGRLDVVLVSLCAGSLAVLATLVAQGGSMIGALAPRGRGR